LSVLFQYFILFFLQVCRYIICAGTLEEPENEYDTEATKKAKVLYESCIDIRK